MRTTLDLDEDVLEEARRLARERGLTLGQAVSELAREGVTRREKPRLRNGWPLAFEKGPVPRDLELVNRLRDEE